MRIKPTSPAPDGRERKGKIVFAITDAQLDALVYYGKDQKHRRPPAPTYRTRRLLNARGLLIDKGTYADSKTILTMAGHYLIKCINTMDLTQP